LDRGEATRSTASPQTVDAKPAKRMPLLVLSIANVSWRAGPDAHDNTAGESSATRPLL
jgi:hypothetical protein